MYRVIDSQTKQVMGTYSTRARASRKADKLDLAYGAYRYSVQRAPEPCLAHFSEQPCPICKLELA